MSCSTGSNGGISRRKQRGGHNTYIRPSNALEDCDQILISLPGDKHNTQNNIIVAFEGKIYGIFNPKERASKELWFDFISTFRPHSTAKWPKGLMYKWFSFYGLKGVLVNSGQDGFIVEALKILGFKKKN